MTNRFSTRCENYMSFENAQKASLQGISKRSLPTFTRTVLGAYLARYCLLFNCVAWVTRPPCVPELQSPRRCLKWASLGPNTCNCCCGWCSWFGVVCMDIYGSCLVSSLVNCPYINRSYWNNKQHKKLSVIYQSISNNSTQVDLTWPNLASSFGCRSRLSRLEKGWGRCSEIKVASFRKIYEIISEKCYWKFVCLHLNWFLWPPSTQF